ncbi:DNA breaking-rejoining protein [Enterobacter roggenkampii]|uniref:DNA breaking-rejoining protein n=1 Tax=Enterobacter roggenkampii TaxID=1812935 RepID=UPI00388D08CA
MFTVKTTEITLSPINSEIAAFKCNASVSGFIHLPDNGAATVVLDGGYKLGAFDCSKCAVKAISFLCIEVEEADKHAGMNYQAYKTAFKAGSSSRVH